MPQQLVHLVYIHGFRGDETTFQAFPTHLQEYLTANIPPQLDLKVQSTLYPTYKSVKPISFATRNFLEWLKSQPPGPVILLAHSMGGLLAAQAATDPSNIKDGNKRIVGMIAFDCPYLGMHPHVVITGIASLLPKKGDPNTKTESQLNADHPDVRIVDRKEADHWEKSQNDSGSSLSPSQPPSQSSSSSSLMPLSNYSQPDSLIGRTMKFVSSHSDDPLVRWARKHSDEPFNAGKRWVIEHFQFGSCMFDPSGLKDRYKALVTWNGLWINYWTMTAPRMSKEHIASGDKMIDQEVANRQKLVDENDVALVQSGITDLSVDLSPVESQDDSDSVYVSAPSRSITPEISPLGPKTKSQAKADAKAAKKEQKAVETERKSEEKKHRKSENERKKEQKVLQKESAKAVVKEKKNKVKVGHHFVVLPTGLGAILGGGDNWEKVVIDGVEDEVAAHCGLFIPIQNMDYEGLVERVGLRVIEWCDKI